MTITPRLPLSSATHSDVLPEPLSETEIETLVDLASRLGARTLMIGHGRDNAACGNAERFGHAWAVSDGIVLGQVSWPEDAASWLRQARQLTTPEPDLWVLGGAAAGLAQMMRRLAWSTSWRPQRTLALGATTITATARLAGPRVVNGTRGVHPDGGLWEVLDGKMALLHPAAIERRGR